MGLVIQWKIMCNIQQSDVAILFPLTHFRFFLLLFFKENPWTLGNVALIRSNLYVDLDLWRIFVHFFQLNENFYVVLRKKTQGRLKVFLILKWGEVGYKLFGNQRSLWSYLKLFKEMSLYRVKFTNLIGEVSFLKDPHK